MEKRRIIVGSRGSKLALIQAHSVMTKLKELSLRTELVTIETLGDKDSNQPLNQLGSVGLFIKELEVSLFNKHIDIAVHSMKDVPSFIPEGLVLAATTERLDPRDVLVSKTPFSICNLPKNARIATGSIRRRSQLKGIRPDLQIEDLRGNVPTRLKKFDNSDWDAIILAGAGLIRLGLKHRISTFIPMEDMIPAVGQGALVLETRKDDLELRKLLEKLNHKNTEAAIEAERAFLSYFDGGCMVPIGANAQINNNILRIQAFVGSADGTQSLSQDLVGTIPEAKNLGLLLAEQMANNGASDIIDNDSLQQNK